MKAQSVQYYFGNLHAHTGFSDGNKDSALSHAWSPADAYAYAKKSLHFDFLGIAEHNHYSAPKNPGFKKQNYQVGLLMANTATQNGKFAALFGMEWGVSSAFNGHVIIYGFPQLIGWEPSVPGVSGNNYEVFNDKNDYDALFKKVIGQTACFAYLAHPNFTNYSSNGSADGSLANGSYIADYDSAIVGVPLRSGLAFSTDSMYRDFPLGDYFSYYKKMLFLGYHVGIGYDHDNHYTTFGRNNAGRLVVLSTELSPAAIVSAIKQRRFYGSDDWNAKIDFRLNGKLMGSIVNGAHYPDLGVMHADDDGEMADSIKIWKGTKNEGYLWAEVIHTALNSNVLAYTDSAVSLGKEYYYFVEIKQKDGDWIVTSPIWFKALAPLGAARRVTEIDLRVFPNPTDNVLRVCTSNYDRYRIEITTLCGEVLLVRDFNAYSTDLSVTHLPAGAYMLNLYASNGLIERRVVLRL
jgi:hypothetical protein